MTEGAGCAYKPLCQVPDSHVDMSTPVGAVMKALIKQALLTYILIC